MSGDAGNQNVRNRKRRTERRLVVALLIAGACGSLTTDQGSDGPEETSLHRSALSPSSSLSAAVAGRIVSPTNSVVTLGIPGEPSVGHDGSASYRVPLWVPEGINGLKPNLALEYNSEAGTGVLGSRWRLTGTSVITRCPKTLAQDGIQRPVDFFDDTFCLDGQRLVRVANSAANAEFRTERESFAKIVGQKAANGDFTSFTVRQRDGLILSFGTTHASRLHGNPRRIDGVLERDLSYAFYLDKIEDRFGNAVTFGYKYGLSSPTTNTSQVQELVPETIKWGPGEKRFVKFLYEALPGGGTVSTRVRWVGGLGIGAAPLLSEIEVHGPDGQGGTPLLKAYQFGYLNLPEGTSGPVTREPALWWISERDDGWVFKKNTLIDWEPGSLEYQRIELESSTATDFRASQYTGNPYVPGGPGVPPTDNYARLYTRILASDLNSDGRDDIVYRGYFFGCVGWLARRTTVGADGLPSLGTPTLLNLGSDPDTACRSSQFGGGASHLSGGNAWPGDIIFADLDNDGYPDILSPVGRSSGFDGQGQQTNKLAGYRAYLNARATTFGTFGRPINFLDSVGVIPSMVDFDASGFTSKRVGVTVGDLDGDTLPEIVRADGWGALTSASLGLGGLASKSELRSGITFNYLECPTASAHCQRTVPGDNWLEDIEVVDLDGDDISEVIRTSILCATFSCTGAKVSSPTMNGTVTLGPATKAFATGARSSRLFVDLNGDALSDVVWLDGSNWRAALNTGRGFASDKSTPIPLSMSAGSAWAEILPMDFNLDGRQDLLVNAALTNGKSSVLISDGTGGFVREEYPIPPVAMDPFTGRVNRVVADLNGDGLPDIVQHEAGKLVAYVRQGKAPAMVTRIAEGDGRTIDFTYDVANGRDTAFYDVRAGQTCDTAPDRLACLNRGRWLVRSMTISGDGRNEHQTFSYEGGVFDKKGRGFLGFVRRYVDGPGSRRTEFTYEPMLHAIKSGTPIYTYRLAMLPATVKSCANTWQGGNPIACERQVHTFFGGWETNGTYTVFPVGFFSETGDCPDSHGPLCSQSSSGYRASGAESHVLTFDGYGNVTRRVVEHRRFPNGNPAGFTVHRTDTEVYNYLPANTDAWLVSLFDPARPSTVTSQTTSPAETVTRATKYEPDTTHGGILAMEVEPNGSAATRLNRRFPRDARGRLQEVRDRDIDSGQVRRTLFSYQEDASDDGVYPWRIMNAKGHATTIRRHPGLGLVVEVVDPNGIASARSYDTFGRVVSETDFSGAFARMTYPDTAATGTEVWIDPEGLMSRRVQISFDAFGQETRRTTPVDANRRVRVDTAYDHRGRLFTETIESVDSAGTSLSTFNTILHFYDDLDRVTTRTRLVSDGTWKSATNAYDGLQVTSTNEAGRTVIRMFDGMGRLETERATLSLNGTPTTSDSTYAYGAFGLLKEQRTVGGSGQTTFGYDVLGRPTSLTRAGVGTRGTRYNSFGDVVASFKVDGTGVESETVTFGRDDIGRLTSISAPSLTTRTFHWDAPASAPGTPAPGAIGKLVDMKAERVDVHYDYFDVNSPGSGLLKKKTWSGGPSWQTPATIGSAEYTYDSQGRIRTLRYPKFEEWSSPLTVRYDYDQHSGKLRAIRNDASPTTPIWELRQENDLGQTTEEWMRMPSTSLQKRTTEYFTATGQVRWSSLLSSSSGQQTINFSYEADGLPSMVVDGSARDDFGYDNLGRMTSWKPSTALTTGPTVTYRYDLDGNLTSRGWSGGQQVTYSQNATSRTVSIPGSSATTYQGDSWGRIYDTPAVNMAYNALDEVTRITPKPGTRASQIYRDGSGERTIAQFGNPSDGQAWWYLYTFDDLAELRRSNTGREERLRLRDDDGRLIGELVRTSNTSTRSATFYLTNNVGSVVAQVSGTGTLTMRARRDPFGNLVSSVSSPTLPSDSTGSNPDGSGRMAYAGHPRDAGWGLVDMAARMYSPRLGRFIAPDPIIADVFDRRDHNPFAYAHNSPAAFWDPSGMATACEPNTQCPGQGIGVPLPIAIGVGGGVLAGYYGYKYRADLQNGAFKGATTAAKLLKFGVDLALGRDRPPQPPQVAQASLPAAQASSASPASGQSVGTGRQGGGNVLTGSGGAWTNSQGERCIGSSCTTSTGGIYSTREWGGSVGGTLMGQQGFNPRLDFASWSAEGGVLVAGMVGGPGAAAARGIAIRGLGQAATQAPKMLGPLSKFGPKIMGQLAKRGWTKETVGRLIDNPARTAVTRDTRFLPGAGRMNDPATAFINSKGHYVIRNDVTGDIVQVSNKFDVGWVSPF